MSDKPRDIVEFEAIAQAMEQDPTLRADFLELELSVEKVSAPFMMPHDPEVEDE